MQFLNEKECIEKIRNGITFQAFVNEGSFSIKVDKYNFFIGAAIHNGHSLRKELIEICNLSNEERLYEEDPYTGELISSMPVTIIGNDSRYEYDLNRSIEECIYNEAWGKKVWKVNLSDDEKQISLNKHRVFYNVLFELVKKVKSLYGAVIIYDIHSYNYKRLNNSSPVFNIGTTQLNKKKWNEVITHWNKLLNNFELPNIKVRSAENEVFFGKGYLAMFINEKFENVLVLPTEVKKVFMNELSGDLYSIVFQELKECFKKAMLKNALYFSKKHTNRRYTKVNVLLPSTIENSILKIDRKLYHFCKNIDTLLYINPKNLIGEKKRFFAKNFNYSPNFTYKQLDIAPYEFKEKLFRLPVDYISDVSIQEFYMDVINTYVEKIELLKTVGTEKFLYNSLKYYGEPSEIDIESAKFLLFANEFEEIDKEEFPAIKIKELFKEAVEEYGINWKVEITDKIVAKAMVNNIQKTIYINKAIKLNRIGINGLIQHEFGVHVLTTINSEQQKLKVFNLGLPGNTCTQEGIAILSEYKSGNLKLKRLKNLALRVLAVHMMIEHNDFSKTFYELINDFNLDLDSAFALTTRVYRGGGFTKDFLYLRGLREALNVYRSRNIESMFIGKTSFKYLDLINEFIERKMASKPKYLPLFLKNIVKTNPITDYLLTSIR